MAEASPKKVIMLLETDVLVRMVLADYLRDCGYRVIEGTSAGDVWTVLGSGVSIDVVLTAVKLPGEVNGFKLASDVRQTFANIDVILTSGVAGALEESQELCKEGPLEAPYHPKELEARIRYVLDRRRV